MENTQVITTDSAASVSATEITAPIEVSIETAIKDGLALLRKTKRVRKAPVAKVVVAAAPVEVAAPVKPKRKPAVKKVLVEAAPVSETRIYTKRVRKFDLKTQNQIVQRVKQVGVVQTANEFNSLYVYISKVCKSRRMKIKLGRRGNVAA